MITKYIIEIWNGHHYEKAYEGNDEERALIMMNKPYYVRCTRRLTKVMYDEVAIAKKDKYLTNDIRQVGYRK